MLSRGVASLWAQVPVRGMATAQALRERVASVKSTRKITSAQKMIATFKLRKAQTALSSARDYARVMDAVDFKPADENKVAKSQLFIGLSADKGFCGAINSSIVRGVRDGCNKALERGLEKAKIMCIGERGRGGLERTFKNYFTLAITDYEKVRNFRQCAELTDMWLEQDVEKTSFFNQQFVSMISYNTNETVFWSYDAVKDDLATQFADYEMEGDNEVLQNLYEFKCAVKMFHFFAELDTSTLSARMQAMDSASNNAGELIDALTLQLNRTRQAKITTELSEIISGAVASEDK